MKFKFLTLLVIFNIFAVISCQQTETPSSSSSSNVNDNKITSLKAVIDEAPEGSTIDLSQYSDITDWNVNINKAVTITNGTINKGELTITASGVTLDNIQGAVNVTTNSSMKISRSSIGNLTIGDSSTAAASQIVGRGGNKLIIQMVYSNAGLVKINRLNENELTQLLVDDSKITTVEAYSETVTIVRSKTSSIKSFKAESKSEFVLEDGATESLVETKTGSKVNEITRTVKSFEADYYGMIKYYDADDNILKESIAKDNEGEYSLDIGKDDKLWNKWFYAVISQNGTNGRISFQIKTDKATYIQPTVKTAITGTGNSTIVQTKANEWTSVKAYTGKIEQGFTKLVLEIPVDSSKEAINVYIKDIIYTELDDDSIDDDAPAIITDSGYSSFDSLGSITTSTDKIIFKSVSASDGFNTSPKVLDVGNIYKVSFTVTADKATDGFCVYPNVNNSEGNVGYNWGWAKNTHLNANTPTTVVAYLASVRDGYYTTYEELTDDINKNPYLKMWISAGNANTLTVKDFKAEVVSITDLPDDTKASWLSWPDHDENTHITDINANTVVMNPGEGIHWRMVIYGKYNNDWYAPINNNNTIVCSSNYLLYDNRLGEGLDISYSNDDFQIINNTGKEVNLKITFDNNSKKVIFTE